MKRKVSRGLWLVMVVVLIIPILVACGPTATTPQPTTPGQTAPTAGQTPVQKMMWRANAITAPTATYNRDPFYGETIRKVLERTGGRLEIQTHWSNELGFGQRDWPKLLKEGLVEISDLPMVMGGNFIPEIAYENIIFHLGPAFDDAKRVDIIKARRPFYEEIVTEWGGKRLASHIAPAASLPEVQEFGSTKPIRSVDDFKGVTIRFSSPEWAALFTPFGVKPIIISMPEQYLALKTGMVDAAGGRGSYIAYKLHEVTKYLVVYHYGVGSFSPYGWAVSMPYWKKLPPDIQKVLIDTYKELENATDATWLPGSKWVPPDTAEIEKYIKDYNIQIIELPDADKAKIYATADKVIAEWLAKTNDRGRAMFKANMQALNRMERYDRLIELGKQITGK